MFYKRKKIVNAKKAEHDNIQFDSGLEKNCYIALTNDEDIKAMYKIEYESEHFELMSKEDNFNFQIYEIKGNHKTMTLKKNMQDIVYTPDFILKDKKTNKIKVIIECKGRANERFPNIWKLFLKKLNSSGFEGVVFKPKDIATIKQMINLIKNEI